MSKLMKKNKKLLSLVLIVIVIISIIGIYSFKGSSNEDILTMKQLVETKYQDIKITGMAETAYFDYNSAMWAEANAVCIVTPLDDLTASNSRIVGEGKDPYYLTYSLRNVKVIEYFKNEDNYGDELTIGENCVLLEDGTLACWSDCYPMLKGNYYLMFLHPTDYPEKPPFAIGVNQGKIDLTNMRLNPRKDLAVKAIIDLFAKNIPEDVQNAFKSSISVFPGRELLSSPEKITNYFEWSDDLNMKMSSDKFESLLGEGKTQEFLEIYDEMAVAFVRKMESYKWTELSIETGYEAKGMNASFRYVKDGDSWYFAIDSNDTRGVPTYYFIYKEN